ncbi:hypothetical protein [Parageobacillus thermoglucosidasius]|nr:hypothetical protein [Parageobacillus thermoglucosidasius]
MKQYRDGITAEEVGKPIVASRTTSRRYLEYLVSISQATRTFCTALLEGRRECTS